MPSNTANTLRSLSVTVAWRVANDSGVNCRQNILDARVLVTSGARTNTLRQRISRLVRKTLSFSKKEYMLNLHSKLFAFFYNQELATNF